MSIREIDTSRLTGGCQCGAVRYAVTADAQEVAVCHCRMCQKASGGPFMVLARFPLSAVAWTRGTVATFASSNLATRGFCSACGTPLTYQWRPDAVSITTGSFDDPDALLPSMRYGIEGLLPWSEHIAQLPTEMTDDWIDADARQRLVNYQHPDHDS